MFRNQLRILREELQQEDPNTEDFRGNAVTSLIETARYWYAGKFFEPRMRTERTVAEVEARFFELFHSVPWGHILLTPDYFSVKWTETSDGLRFCSFPPFVKFPEPEHTELLLLLDTIVPDKARPKMVGAGFNAYVEDGKVRPVQGTVFSTEDILSLIEAGVEAVDAELVRLDRPVTPENRTAYLLMDPVERRFKNTWFYYDLGVTDNHKVIAFKKSGIKDKKKVGMYNALPHEMFYELLSLEAGEELARPEWLEE